VLLLLLRACSLLVLHAAVQHLRVLRQGGCRQLQVGCSEVGAALPQRPHPGVQARCTCSRRCSPCRQRCHTVSQQHTYAAEVVLRVAVVTYNGSMNSKYSATPVHRRGTIKVRTSAEAVHLDAVIMVLSHAAMHLCSTTGRRGNRSMADVAERSFWGIYRGSKPQLRQPKASCYFAVGMCMGMHHHG
jgi:hypothetical protein